MLKYLHKTALTNNVKFAVCIDIGTQHCKHVEFKFTTRSEAKQIKLSTTLINYISK